MQINRTPQITFGIKHSPLLGQLKPIEPLRSTSNQVTQKITTTTTTKVVPIKETNDLLQSQTNVSRVQTTDNDITRTENVHKSNQTSSQVQNTQTHVTHVRAESELRSSTDTPEHVQEKLTQELVWVPEKPIRRGSYTIDKADGLVERFQHSELIPVENGMISVAASGERGAVCSEENISAVIRKEGFEQSVQKKMQNASAHEKSQSASEEVRTGTDVQQLPNGGIAKTTTTTTIRKVGTAAKTANSSTTVTRTATAVTSRDVGTK